MSPAAMVWQPLLGLAAYTRVCRPRCATLWHHRALGLSSDYWAEVVEVRSCGVLDTTPRLSYVGHDVPLSVWVVTSVWSQHSGWTTHDAGDNGRRALLLASMRQDGGENEVITRAREAYIILGAFGRFRRHSTHTRFTLSNSLRSSSICDQDFRLIYEMYGD